MGYRSDVKIVIGCDNEFWFKKFKIHAELAYGDSMDYKEMMELVRIEDRTMYFHYEDIKWYSSYEFVQLHGKLMHDVQDFRGGYAFARLGEEEGDTERESREYDSNCVFDDVIHMESRSYFQIDEPEIIEPYVNP